MFYLVFISYLLLLSYFDLQHYFMNNQHPITECIQTQLQDYLNDLKGTPPTDIYQMVLAVVEKPMLELVMQHAKHNQSLAAQYLGINRNTLHKKLVEHQLLK